jgi:hypothetical protein
MQEERLEGSWGFFPARPEAAEGPPPTKKREAMGRGLVARTPKRGRGCADWRHLDEPQLRNRLAPNCCLPACVASAAGTARIECVTCYK